jgi:hypothetical protein
VNVPFENSLAHAFTAGSIRAHAPTLPGVYGISNSRQWIYIGHTDNIQGTLFSHLQERESQVGRSRPTGFVFELAWPEQQNERCGRLIREYAPVCNEAAPRGLRKDRF